jgi:hypothetical protein
VVETTAEISTCPKRLSTPDFYKTALTDGTENSRTQSSFLFPAWQSFLLFMQRSIDSKSKAAEPKRIRLLLIDNARRNKQGKFRSALLLTKV